MIGRKIMTMFKISKVTTFLISIMMITILLCCSSQVQAAQSGTLDNWHLRNALSQGNSIVSVTYGDNTFVGVGASGTIISSSDGITWTSRTSSSTKAFEGVTYGKDTFVAVGESGTILTSTDGISWTSRTSGTPQWLEEVTYGKNIFVALGDSGTILTSPDGITWTSQTSGTPKQLFGVAYVNNTFVAVGESGTILTSTDGISWTSRTSGTTNFLWGVTHDNNTFVAVGESGAILTSLDGMTWTSRTSGSIQTLTRVAHGNNTFVAVGYSGTILTSPDGINWTIRTSGTTENLYGETYGSNTFVVVGHNGTILQSDTLNQSNITFGGTAIPLGSSPTAVAVNSVTNKIYVTGYDSSGSSVTVINGDTNTTRAAISLGNYCPTAVAVNSVTNKIYVMGSDSSGSNVTVINGDTNTTGAAISLGNYYSTAVAVNSVTNKIYVVYAIPQQSAYVAMIDGDTNTTTTGAAISVEAIYPPAMVVNPITNKLYVTNGSDSIMVMDGAAATPNMTQPVDQTVNQGGSANLSVAASGGVSLSYQWYSSATNTNSSGSPITGATGSSYSAPTDTVGTTYYYCVVTNFDSNAYVNQTATATSSVAKVVVNATIAITVSADQTNVAITSDMLTSAGTNPIAINVPSDVTNATLTVASFLQIPSSGIVKSSALPALTISADVHLTNGSTPINVQVQIPQGTTVSAPVGWDGTINVPTVQATNSVTVTPSSGNTASVNSVIEVGYGNVPLTFDHAVRLLIPGQAGKKVGYVRSGTFYPISTIVRADDQTTADHTLAAGQDGYLNVGPDLVIWTKHFTQFVIYTETAISTSSRGTSGGGRTAAPTTTPTIPTPIVSSVQRLFGQNQVDTSLAIAKANYPDKVANVVLATADNYPDALAGSVLAYQLKAPILLVGSTDADKEKILAYLKSNLNGTGTVYILGGTAVVSADMEAKVTANGFSHITRLGGIDRYATSVKIADQLGVKTGTPIVLAYGENYPDALSISSIAAGMQSPILLVQKDGISDIIKQEIAKIKPAKIYIIGGEGVIGATVENQVAQITSLDKTNIVRIAGVDRYETSLAVAQYFNLTGNVCIATGNNFPDALAGSVYAANHNAPIILADGNLSDQVMNYLKSKKLTGATIFGGEAVISKDIKQQLGQLIGQ